ncbi:MAG: FtsX-like permease family protein [Bacteroidales bacterium]|nr:FtsX-like permease family protein [Bacteroidales bacterium]
MKLEFFIARRLVAGDKDNNNRLSAPVIRIAVAAVALSVCVMLVSLAVIIGFRNEIMNKVVGFGSCVSIINRESAANLETLPISEHQDFYRSIENEDGISHIQRYALKPAIFKSGSDIMGVVLKGVGQEYDLGFINSCLVDGEADLSTDSIRNRKSIVVSQKMASSLDLHVGDDLVAYFVQDPPKMRKYHVSGIYSTGLEDCDKIFAFIDIDEIRAVNNWPDYNITGFEVMVDDFDRLDEMTDLVRDYAGFRIAEDGSMMRVQSVRETNRQLFDWITLTEMNVWVILGIMFFVAFVNMSTALLIIIFEKAAMIGLMKSMGATNWLIRKIFVIKSLYILLKGVVIGNLVALVVICLEHFFQLVRLAAASYYVDLVPCGLELWYFVAIDIVTLVGMMLLLVIPSMAISRMEPAKVMGFK